jgi:hypothetical protein
VTERDLHDLFEKFGSIVDVRIVVEPRTRVSKGYGFVRFKVRTYLHAWRRPNRIVPAAWLPFGGGADPRLPTPLTTHPYAPTNKNRRRRRARTRPRR